MGDGDHSVVPIWVWQIGDMSLVAVENEAYSTLQTTLRNTFPDHVIAVLGLVNGGSSYLPPRHLYEREIYQVWQTPFAAGCLEATIEAATSAIAELARPFPATRVLRDRFSVLDFS